MCSTLSNSILGDFNPTLTGATASVPKARVNGVSWVADLRVVLYSHNTSGRYSTHLPLRSSYLVLQCCFKGSDGDFCLSIRLRMCRRRVIILDPELGTKSLNLALSNCFPLYDTRALGIPNLHIIERHTKLRIFCFVIVAKGSASAHLVK